MRTNEATTGPSVPRDAFTIAECFAPLDKSSIEATFSVVGLGDDRVEMTAQCKFDSSISPTVMA